MSVGRLVLAWAIACGLGAAHAQPQAVRVLDDAGREVTLATAARRIVSLAPHATELLYAIGAGDLVVGTVAHADHPEAAKRIRRVGDSAMLDLEAIALLKPDLIVAWKHGNSDRHLGQLARIGAPIYYSAAPSLDRIAESMSSLGTLVDRTREARLAASAYSARLSAIRRRYAGRPVVPVFFQVWERPLMTVNGQQVLTDGLRACGARNVFENERMLVATVDAESVVRAQPEAVVRTAAAEEHDAFAIWRRLPHFAPTRAGNLITLRTDALGRPSPRILDGVQMLCDALEGVRNRRGQ